MTKTVNEWEVKRIKPISILCTRWLDSFEMACNIRAQELRHAKLKCTDSEQFRDCMTSKKDGMIV